MGLGGVNYTYEAIGYGVLPKNVYEQDLAGVNLGYVKEYSPGLPSTLYTTNNFQINNNTYGRSNISFPTCNQTDNSGQYQMYIFFQVNES